MKQKMKSLMNLLLAAILVLSLVGCGAKSEKQDSQKPSQTESQTESQAVSQESEEQENVLGEGSTVFTFVVVDGEGTETSFEIHTDAKTVGEALVALKLIEGEESEYGLYVKKVNGITADYDVDQTYWAFYINGEYASTGVDATNVEAGATYSFKVEK